MKTSALLVFALGFSTAAHGQLREPDTVFFGKIFHHGGGEPRLLTTGALSWQIDAPDGALLPLKTTLTPLDNGSFSYSLRVPRHLAITGLPASSAPAGLPVLADATLRYRHAVISVDGHPARLADPAALGFPADGSTRAEFVRADLIVDFPLPDADGDGLPDWWEEKYRLDAQLASATADSDDDGITDLAEFRAGTDPSFKGTSPRLAAEWRVTLPESGSAALLVKAIDPDTPVGLLRYKLNSLPASVNIVVQNGLPDGVGDRPVRVGNNFTQEEIDAGRVLISSSAAVRGATAEIILQDENPAHAPVSAVVLFSTASRADILAAGQLRSAAWVDGRVLHDASASPLPVTLRASSGPIQPANLLPPANYAEIHVPQHGRDLPRLFLGSPLADVLLGSGEADVLAAGAGDDVLAGHSGPDRFVFADLGGTDQIVDFSVEQRDVIDLAALLKPAVGKVLTDFVVMENGVLRVDANGDGSGFTDASIQLPTPQPDLAELWDAGSLDMGAIVPRTAIFLSATDAAEEGLAEGAVTIRRRGDASMALTISLQVTGTAIAGRDYVALPSTVTFAPGQKVIMLRVMPLADDLRETPETVEIAVTPTADFTLGASAATVRITDEPVRVWMEVVDRVAFKDSLSPAQVLLRRSGPLSSGLTVLFQTGGKATPGVDYRRPSSSVTFGSGQDVLSVEIMPLATASLTSGCEDVLLTLREDVSYQIGGFSNARLVICERPRTFAEWRATRMPGDSMAEEEFLAADRDGDGFNGLMEFALNLNPDGPDSPDKTNTSVVFDASGIPGLEFRRRPGAPEIISTVCCSTDLKTWRPLTPADSEERAVVIESDGMERVRHFLKSKPAEGKIYFRLCIDRQ